MASGPDVQKRQAWANRIGRFRMSGLTVARFCQQEGVSANTFYYWAKRVGAATVRACSSTSDSVSRHGCQSVKHTSAAAGLSSAALVRFHCRAAVTVLGALVLT